ncbi:MAG: DinB family protein [Cyclobacteriaceae bacterium]|nr:DinB family protein [Cyclobacteriaceae bacterium]
MENTTAELAQIVNNFSARLNTLADVEFTAKPDPQKWSKQEVLGHLVDSAQNNLRRFIVGQYQSTPPKIVYDQDFWVKANAYQNMKKEDVIMLWKFINERIIDVLNTMPPENHARLCDTGKDTVQLHTIEWLASDYVRHMKHHLNQIFPESFDVVYV